MNFDSEGELWNVDLKEMRYYYDKNNRRKKMVVKDTRRGKILQNLTYKYEGEHLEELIDWTQKENPQKYEFAYDFNGRLKEIKYPNGVVEEYKNSPNGLPGEIGVFPVGSRDEKMFRYQYQKGYGYYPINRHHNLVRKDVRGERHYAYIYENYTFDGLDRINWYRCDGVYSSPREREYQYHRDGEREVVKDFSLIRQGDEWVKELTSERQYRYFSEQFVD
jgi:hypothetical protein